MTKLEPVLDEKNGKNRALRAVTFKNGKKVNTIVQKIKSIKLVKPTHNKVLTKKSKNVILTPIVPKKKSNPKKVV